MGNQRLIQTQTAATDQKQHLDKRTQQPESSLEEVLSSRAASRHFRAQLQRHQAEGVASPNPLNSILQMISSVSPRAIQAKPKFRGLSHELTSALDSRGMVIQAKMTLGAPGDKYEQEADRVAEQVVQKMHAPSTPESVLGGPLQHQDGKEDRHALRMKPLAQRPSVGGMAATQDLESSINRARGGGQPLEAGLQRKLGQAMGADFSGVKVHTDNQADQLNRSIQAKAFTTGQDVFFRQGAYEPGSRGGQELIAHELTHVVQQNGGAAKISKSHATVIQRFKDKLEDSTEVTENDINQASKEKLKEWLARTSEGLDWDDEGMALVPDPDENKKIEAAISAIEEANAEQAKLEELGVTAEQLLLFQNTTSDENLIKKCASVIVTRKWDVTAVLTSLAAYILEVREMVLSVLAKGEVTNIDALNTLASSWGDMKDKLTINIKTLTTLIEAKAVIVMGGTYKVPQLTGTEDTAYCFYFNGRQPIRIKPEWHVHITNKELERPGFKNQGDKYNVGPGTRVETNPKDSQNLLTACQKP
jgi:Domain of unknown function (DUF4157)